MKFWKAYMFIVPFMTGVIVFYVLCGISLASQEGQIKYISKDFNVISIISTIIFTVFFVLMIIIRFIYIMIKKIQFNDMFEFKAPTYSDWKWQKIYQPVIADKLTKRAKGLKALMDAEEALLESSGVLQTEIPDRIKKLSEIQAQIKFGKKKFWKMYHLAEDFDFTVLKNMTEYQKL